MSTASRSRRRGSSRRSRTPSAAADELRFPVVVKPALKTSLLAAQQPPRSIARRARRGCWSSSHELSPWTDELIVQEWIEGADADLFSCNCYFDRDGAPVVTFVARKLRQWPPDAGTSSLGEEVRNDEVLGETLRLFGASATAAWATSR